MGFMLAFVLFLGVQVSDHGDRGDCDLPGQRNESTTSSTNDSVGFQVSLHHKSVYLQLGTCTVACLIVARPDLG